MFVISLHSVFQITTPAQSKKQPLIVLKVWITASDWSTESAKEWLVDV